LPAKRFDREAYFRLIKGETKGFRALLARTALSVVSAGYRVGVFARNFAFDRGWKHIERVPIPVVSVGNITLGGTGKTPMVEWVARWFRRQNLRVTLLSRGYGETDGMNDEGLVLEDNLPDCPHLQGRDRAELAHVAIEELEAQALVLDDGFQHRRLGRSLDIVLLDALEPFGLNRLFPRGLLREPISSLKRAGIVVLSRADLVEAERRAAIRAQAERRAGPLRWIEARHAPKELRNSEGSVIALGELPARRTAAFCGIGNPEGFRKTLERLGVRPLEFRLFPDHHPYTRADVDALAKWGRGLGVDLILTTQKDLVKLRTETLGLIPLYALVIGLELMSPEDEATLDGALRRLWPDQGPGDGRTA
jgi:tetraacyldisaccharide 4'-kinase